MCYKNDNRDIKLNITFQDCHIHFFNSDFSVENQSNVTKSLGYVLCSTLEGSVSQNFDLGPGYFFYVM